jgi:hypothetical protein
MKELVYAIQHKDGRFLPQKGPTPPTWATPAKASVTCPRLFSHERHAHLALTAYLKGRAIVSWYDDEPGPIEYHPLQDRNQADYKVVPLVLTDEISP